MKYTLKQRVQGGYRKTEYEIKASALPKLFAYAKKVKAEVFDEEDNLVDIETKGKEQVLMAAINSEWETIRGYEASIDLFTEDEQAVIRDIIKEEKVHIGQFQAILDNIGSDVSPSIEEGVNEGQEQLGGDIELLEASMKRRRPSRRNSSKERTRNVPRSIYKAIEKATGDANYAPIWVNEGDYADRGANTAYEIILKRGDKNLALIEQELSNIGYRSIGKESSSKEVVLIVARTNARRFLDWDDYNASRRPSKKVKCSIGELVEQEILSEDKAKEAYALGFRDALGVVEDVEGEGDHIDIGYDPDSEIEYDEGDPISAEQAVYDLGVKDAGGADENEEFDDDVFEEEEDE